MTSTEPQPSTPPPPTPPFQFSLRTLLLLFVVLGSSLGVFGGWGVVVFGLVVGLAIYFHHAQSLSSLTSLVSVVLCLLCLIGWLLTADESIRETARRAACANHLKEIAAAVQAYRQANGRSPPAYIADKTASQCAVGGCSYCPTWATMTFTRLTTSANLGTGRRTSRYRPCPSWSMPALAAFAPAGRRCRDKLCRRGGAKHRLAGREIDKTRPGRFSGRGLQHDPGR